MKKNITILILCIIFGFAGGMASYFYSRYFLNDYFKNLMYLRELDLSGGTQNGSLVISGASKIIIELEDKVGEIVDSSKKSIVGVYQKKKILSNSTFFDQKNFYKQNENIGQGLIITNDGWAVICGAQQDFKRIGPENLVIIAGDKKLYDIDQIYKSDIEGFYYLHAKNVKDLNVNKFIGKTDSIKGKTIIAINWQLDNLLTYVEDFQNKMTDIVKSSESNIKILKTVNFVTKDYIGSAIFDLNNNVVALVDQKDELVSINSFGPEINSILKYNSIKKPFLGINYVNYSNLIPADGKKYFGAIITKNSENLSIIKNSPAEKAGLKEGDVIISIDGIEINETNDIDLLISDYEYNDTIKITYLRKGVQSDVEVKLISLEK
jgi:hypothetical protein